MAGNDVENSFDALAHVLRLFLKEEWKLFFSADLWQELYQRKDRARSLSRNRVVSGSGFRGVWLGGAVQEGSFHNDDDDTDMIT